MGAFVVLAIAVLIAGWFVGGAVLAFFAIGLHELGAPVRAQRATFVVLGVAILSPMLAPAGTLAVMPVPLGVMLAFTRSVSDFSYFARMWWFVVPSLLITALICWGIARRVFPN